MAILPVSSVSFRNNNISFEAKKKNDKNISVENSRSSMLKAIPLAALIAMSPLNSAKAQSFAANEKIVNFEQYDETKKGFGNVVLWFVSNDGNDDNAEILRYSTTKTTKSGLKNTVTYNQNKTCDLSKFTIVNVSSKYGNSKEYYISGPGSLKVSRDGAKVSSKNYENLSIQISPEMFKYLKDMVGNQVECTTESRVDNYDDDDEDIFSF